MANTFKNYLQKNVTTAASSVATGTTLATTVIGASFANTTAASVTVDLYITSSAVDYYLIKGAVCAPYNSLVLIGGEQKVVLESGDILKVIANTVTCGDLVVSCLEMT